MSSLLHLLFGCPHRHYTFPITAKAGQKRPAAAELTGTYVVCMDCARELAYDWHEMKLVLSRRNAPGQCSSEAAPRAA